VAAAATVAADRCQHALLMLLAMMCVAALLGVWV
jgi:hypothetical protein